MLNTLLEVEPHSDQQLYRVVVTDVGHEHFFVADVEQLEGALEVGLHGTVFDSQRRGHFFDRQTQGRERQAFDLAAS